jgi:hypothetical protein
MADAKKPPPLPFKRKASSSCVIRLPPSSIHLLHESDANDDGVRWMIIGKTFRYIHTIDWDTCIYLYICIGGYDDLIQISSCISYTPSLNKWVDMPSLNVARYHSTLSVWKGWKLELIPPQFNAFLSFFRSVSPPQPSEHFIIIRTQTI